MNIDAVRRTTVSVVMATFNGERFLRAQLDSILACLEPDDEFVVVDDCSTDGTLEILQALRWPNLTVMRNASNEGVLRTFERGLCQATGEVIFLSDQDDLWLQGKRSVFVREFDSDPDCSVVISDASIVDQEGREMARSFMQGRGGFRGDALGNVLRNRFIGCSMAVRASLVKLALPIPRTAPLHDMYLGIVGSLVGTVHYLDRPYLKHRRHGTNASPSSRASWLRVAHWRVNLVLALIEACSRPAMRRAILEFRRSGSGRRRVPSATPGPG